MDREVAGDPAVGEPADAHILVLLDSAAVDDVQRHRTEQHGEAEADAQRRPPPPDRAPLENACHNRQSCTGQFSDSPPCSADGQLFIHSSTDGPK